MKRFELVIKMDLHRLTAENQAAETKSVAMAQAAFDAIVNFEGGKMAHGARAFDLLTRGLSEFPAFKNLCEGSKELTGQAIAIGWLDVSVRANQ